MLGLEIQSNRKRSLWRPLMHAILLLALASSSSAVVVDVVATAQELQTAITDGASFIRLTGHINLTDINKGTAAENSLELPNSSGDITIWVRCPKGTG